MVNRAQSVKLHWNGHHENVITVDMTNLKQYGRTITTYLRPTYRNSLHVNSYMHTDNSRMY